MKILFASIFIFCASVMMVLGQGAEGFHRFRDNSSEFNSGSFVGENGINWNFVQSRNFASILENGVEKSKLVLKNDTTAEISSSVISSGIGLLKIDYSTISNAPVKLDVYVNRTKVATLISPASDNVFSLSSDNIPVNMDKPFYIRIKQADETSGEVVIDKVMWSTYGSTEYGLLQENLILPQPVETSLKSGTQKDINLSYHLFPNPAKDFVLVETTRDQSVLLKLYSLAGQIVIQEQVKGSGQKINISNLKEGLYIYKILDDRGKLTTGKLIVR